MRVMEDIVENFLLEKLGEEIKLCKDVEEKASMCGKLVTISRECEVVKKLMEEKREGTGAAVKGRRREKLYYVLNLITEWCQILEKQQFRSLDDIPRRLKQVKTELEEAAKPEQVAEASQEAEVYRWSSHAAPLAEIHGFHDKLQMMERLLCQTKAVVGISGVAGVGKTALCQKAYNHPAVRDHFPLRIWLCLSSQQVAASFEDHLKSMLACLGFEDKVIKDTQNLQLAVRRQFKRGRCLVVLDDVWTVDEEIRKLFDFLTPQTTLLLTTRSPHLQLVAPSNMHRLLPLKADDSCWKIFTDAYKEEDPLTEPPEDFANLKPDILDKCAGLPLMAKMLGKIAPTVAAPTSNITTT